jgi:hypothetical protein
LYDGSDDDNDNKVMKIWTKTVAWSLFSRVEAVKRHINRLEERKTEKDGCMK